MVDGAVIKAVWGRHTGSARGDGPSRRSRFERGSDPLNRRNPPRLGNPEMVRHSWPIVRTAQPSLGALRPAARRLVRQDRGSFRRNGR